MENTSPNTVQVELDSPSPRASAAQQSAAEAVTPVAVVTPDEASAMYLTPSQSAAIIKLTSGATKAAAAAAAGVTRATLYKWLNHDANFQAAFNSWHKDVMSTAQSQLLAASQDAIACVINSIRRGDSRLAWKLLESQGMTKLGKPGSTDVGHLQRQEELELKRSEIRERKEINSVVVEDLTTF